MGGVSLEEVIEAYYDCRRRKRNTVNALEFEMDYERHCIDLWHELNEHRYEPRRSIAFVVEYPVKREIFAADFRDRVVHHLIARRMYALLEAQFHPDSYSTQKGKGTLYGILRVEQHLRECSENYTRDCYIMKLDISGYFMSISKQRLYDCVRQFLEERYPRRDLPMLLYMLRKTIFNRPERNCVRKVPRSRWRGLPANKSLFGTDGNYGLPIGNLTSQLLALLFLDDLDHRVTGEWGVPHYGRYVDDMVLIHPSAQHLLDVRRKIGTWLGSRGLKLHPRKMYLQHYAKGVMFVGGMVKPGRKYVSRRTAGRLLARVNYYNALLAARKDVTGGEAQGMAGNVEGLTDSEVEGMVATVNSYLGMMCHYNSRHLFFLMLSRVSGDWYRYVYFTHRGRRCKVVHNRCYRRGYGGAVVRCYENSNGDETYCRSKSLSVWWKEAYFSLR